jgi:hypothetical protein
MITSEVPISGLGNPSLIQKALIAFLKPRVRKRTVPEPVNCTYNRIARLV